MISVKRKKFFFNIQDVYFAEDSEKVLVEKGTDIVIFVQAADKSLGSKEFHTQIIDLTRSEEEIFSEIHANDRNKINKGIKNKELIVKLNTCPSAQDIESFIEFFKIFAKKKGIKSCSISRINSLLKNKSLIIGTIEESSGEILCYHIYALDGERVRLMYSVSKYILGHDSRYRNNIGIANRYLHWYEIKYFKNRGLSVYDFGGISMEKEDTHMMNINRFKKGFGGKEIIEYNKYKGITLIGRILVWILRKNA